ncbi:hypothetical protein H4F44_26450, partial [Escherichia coli]|uniref:magnesium chelatase subunit ChlI family protein n=1 Tax=Escherichia coli TaxID=562 RepID=UPI003F79F67C|nr:hypothetical protein [Escherichia coli]
ALLERAVDALQLTARSMQRILRVARTIADLDGSDAIGTAHLTEAIGFRRAGASGEAGPARRGRPAPGAALDAAGARR